MTDNWKTVSVDGKPVGWALVVSGRGPYQGGTKIKELAIHQEHVNIAGGYSMYTTSKDPTEPQEPDLFGFYNVLVGGVQTALYFRDNKGRWLGFGVDGSADVVSWERVLARVTPYELRYINGMDVSDD